MNIIGKSECTASQMAQYLISKNPNAKSWALEYAQLYLEEGEVEGVRGDGAWIQSCKETGNFKFSGGTAVTFDQNNFCGLGVTSKGMKGHSFETPRLGIRAQIQHLKGYATSMPLINTCIDPRYKYIAKGCAPRFEDLAGRWAVPGYDTSKASSLEDAMNKGIGYGFDIIAGIEQMKKIVVINSNTTTTSSASTNLYRVQCGAYSVKTNATTLQTRLKSAGFDGIIKQVGNLYKVQLGAYSQRVNAESMLTKVKNKGFEAIIVYDGEQTTNTAKDDIMVNVNKKYKVAIDAGHGSNTAGKRMPDGYREHWINVDVADFLEDALLRCGFDVLKVAWDDENATDDTDVALGTRQAQIKQAECDASVSCHANAYGDGASYNTGQGVETLIHSIAAYVGDSKKLADRVQSYLIQGTSQKNRGVKTSNLAMCNCVAMGTKASILVEIGFMTNKYEADLMKTEAFCKECAEEIAHGVCDYFGVEYKKPSGVVSTTPPNTSTNTSTSVTPTVNVTYAVKVEGGKVLPAVTNLANYAGIENKKITGIAMKVDKGTIKYQVHEVGGDWLPYVTGYNWNDHKNGYAGNNKPIDAVRVYYNTPSDLVANGGYRETKYRVSPVGSVSYYDWQLDDTVNKAKGMDGYAGTFGKAIDKFQICIE